MTNAAKRFVNMMFSQLENPCGFFRYENIWRVREHPEALRPPAFTRNDLLFTMSDNPRTFAEPERRDGMCGIFVSRTNFSRRSPVWLSNRNCKAAKAGGARRDRTDDLLLAKQALSQLSYGPAAGGKCAATSA